MIEVILISWAALGLSLPIAKLFGVIDRAHTRKKQGKKTTIRDVASDVKAMQAAENAAYEQTARALCGGDRAPKVAVKAAKLAMKAMTNYATPSPTDLLDHGTPDHPKKE